MRDPHFGLQIWLIMMVNQHSRRRCSSRLLSVSPGDALAPQELFDARTAIESAPPTLLGSAVSKVGLVVHGAVVYMYGTTVVQSSTSCYMI